MENRKKNDEFRKIAERLIETEPELAAVRGSSVRITYLESDKEKKSTRESIVQGECEKVASKNRWAIPSDFTITLYRPNIQGMTEEQVSILLFHELLHVGISVGKKGEETYYVRRHDLSDFKAIVDRFGTGWAETKEV